MSINLKALINKLNDPTRNVLQAAAGLCLSRTHYDIEIEHYLLKLIDDSQLDFDPILKAFGVNRQRLMTDLNRSLDKLKSGNARTPALSPTLVKMLTNAWTIGSLEYAAQEVRSGFTVLAIVSDDELLRLVKEVTGEFSKIDLQTLQKDFYAILANSRETAIGAPPLSEEQISASGHASGKTPNLDQYAVNLTAKAREGKIDPVLGRDKEIRQIVDILMRRRQNNPILTGEAGVGKTAVVEGFACRVVAGDVPPPLLNVSIHTLDLALLQAGAGVKGEFENRLKGLIAEIKSAPTPIILFIDEAHTMIGAGGAAGQGDAANLLKPALARGELRTIAATTWSEYKKYFEKDAALARRFQVVKVEEPSEEQCTVMLRGITPSLEKHHSLRILDQALTAAVKLSHRYLAGRQLPDKAVSVLDTACARLALGQSSTPPPIEEATRRLEDLRVQKRILARESVVGADHSERLSQIDAELAGLETKLAQLRTRWEKERELVSRIRELRQRLEQSLEPSALGEAEYPKGNADPLRKELRDAEQELRSVQGEQPFVQVCVDEQIVGEVMSDWTGIPIGKMVKDEISIVLNLEQHLGSRVIGQSHALNYIGQRIVTSRASLEDPGKPVGVFMLVGPSGVGKTETALALSDLLYGGERNLITINMSEFQEAHTVSSLKGSPPGYVGYGEGGVLTEAVRRRPYSVVLLDEVEKAHPDVLELFYQVFDKGLMEDAEGREIDFKNTIIILTTNAGTDTMMKLCADPETMPDSEGLMKALKPELNKIFKPAFLGRLLIVPYYPIRDEALNKIIRIKLNRIKNRLFDNHRMELRYDDALIKEVAQRCTEVESGARNVDNILTNTLLPEISRELLRRIAAGEPLERITVGVDQDGKFKYQVGSLELSSIAASH